MTSGILTHLLRAPTRRRALVAAGMLVLAIRPEPAGAQVTTICHATGDPAAPYQQVDVAPADALDHAQHREDLVPAPAGGCPAELVAGAPEPASEYPVADVVPAPAARPRRERRAPAPAAAPQGAVAPAAAAGGLSATASLRGDTLPLTGSEVPMVALAGLGFLLAGAGLRLRLAGQAR